MAKDDYHVIVYQILAYLYSCLKRGVDIDKRMLEVDSSLFADINQRYWTYIISNMFDMELIRGLTLINADGGDLPFIADLDKTYITPKGIEYLIDNSFMKKAKQILKEMKEIIPFY